MLIAITTVIIHRININFNSIAVIALYYSNIINYGPMWNKVCANKAEASLGVLVAKRSFSILLLFAKHLERCSFSNCINNSLMWEHLKFPIPTYLLLNKRRILEFDASRFLARIRNSPVSSLRDFRGSSPATDFSTFSHLVPERSNGVVNSLKRAPAGISWISVCALPRDVHVRRIDWFYLS